MTEEWRPIVNYEGCYEISNLGNLRSVDRVSHSYGNRYYQRVGRDIKLYYPKNRYAITTLSKEGIVMSYSVHRLVATTFIPNPNNYPDIDHIDRNRHNNAVTNLRWATKVMNQSNRGTPKHNTSGEMYIRQLANGIYKFMITRDGKQIQKNFKTLEDAIAFRTVVLNTLETIP